MPAETTSTAPKAAPGKTCGTCTLCCKVMAINALEKPSGTWCKHCEAGAGCGIYAQRPRECEAFMCLWLTDPELGPAWKPEKSKFVITLARDRNGLEVRCDPGFPNAWRRAPYHRQILAWAEGARSHRGIVTIAVGHLVTLIAPEGEIPLGQMRDGDRIVVDYAGNRLVTAKIVKSGEPTTAGGRRA